MNHYMAVVTLGLLLAHGIHAQEKVFVIPDIDRVLPQIANGELAGGQIFFTGFEAISLSDAPASVRLDFFDSTGNPITLPFGTPTGDIIRLGTLDEIIAPGDLLFNQTFPFGEVIQVGYARVTIEPEGSAAVLATFNNQVPGERLYRASVPMDTDLHSRFFMAYNNTGGVVSSLAIVSAPAQTVDVIAHDRTSGTERCRNSFLFETRQHLAIILETALPCTAGIDGIIEVSGSAGFGLSGIGFEASDQGLGAFVTKPVYETF